MTRTVVIVGAGPAGLTAAYELLRQSSDWRVVVLEAAAQVGGLARTERHRGNRIDIGGHRFFSKVDWVMDWWRDILPAPAAMAQYRPGPDPSTNLEAADALARAAPERSLLIRPRLSRILHLRKFFDYPITLNRTTLANLGPVRIARVGASYVRARVAPIRPERNLEDFLVNRFGRRLYRTFFKDYTEKVWGVDCKEISPEWGAQRIKGLSVTRALLHALRKAAGRTAGDIGQKGVETSLIERFLYPKHGPGQMWETVAERVTARGGEIRMGARLVALRMADGRVRDVTCEDAATGARTQIACDAVISSMPLKDLAGAADPPPPPDVLAVATGLAYRDFITVGVLLSRMRPSAQARRGFANHLVPDTWIYVQEPDVRVGRVQFFNNWSPAMVGDPARIWLGLEYFCNEGDDLWRMDADALGALARAELVELGLADADAILDTTVIKVEKAYPAYFGSYGEFARLRGWLDGVPNLYPVGRNGMHRYNNQDHSMVSARMAVACLLDPARDKTAIWDVNVEQEYHEEAAAGRPSAA
ncbi:MAG: NAD(P)/FAD-dependent oxidoreductase [Burkholderiales bacterium]